MRRDLFLIEFGFVKCLWKISFHYNVACMVVTDQNSKWQTVCPKTQQQNDWPGINVEERLTGKGLHLFLSLCHALIIRLHWVTPIICWGADVRAKHTNACNYFRDYDLLTSQAAKVGSVLLTVITDVRRSEKVPRTRSMQ